MRFEDIEAMPSKDLYQLPNYIQSQAIGLGNKMIDPEAYFLKMFDPKPTRSRNMSDVLAGISEEEIAAQMALEDAAYQEYLDDVERERKMLMRE